MTAETLTFRLEGWEELEKTLLDYRDNATGKNPQGKVLKLMRDAASAAVGPVAQQIIAAAPVDEKSDTPGAHIRDRIGYLSRLVKPRDSRSSYHVPGDVVYGVIYLASNEATLAAEFGTDKQSPNPFIRSTFERNAQAMIARAQRVMEAGTAFLTQPTKKGK